MHEGLSPLAAYEELMRFANRRGGAALRLALHASVPQDFQPELLHLLKRNFVPEAADDPTAEADVLFAPFCEDMGGGYFRFDQQMRSLLLDNLASSYSSEPVPRVQRVANFLLFYVEHAGRVTSGSNDPLWKDYLEVQRWVALAFMEPGVAAGQLAEALARADEGRDFAARIQLGGLASALSTPLGGYHRLLNYAAAVQALELGDHVKAERLLRGLRGYEITVGEVRLRPASEVLEDWYARHPEVSPAQPPAEEEAAAETHATPESVETTEALLDDARGDSVVAGETAASPADVLLYEKDGAAREDAVKTLARIGDVDALSAILQVIQDADERVRAAAMEAVAYAEERRQFVLVLGNFALSSPGWWKRLRDSFGEFLSNPSQSQNRLEAITDPLHERGYPTAVYNLKKTKGRDVIEDVATLLRLTRFVILDVTRAEQWAQELGTVLHYNRTIPVSLLVDSTTRMHREFIGLLGNPSVLPFYRYKDAVALRVQFDEEVLGPLEATEKELQGEARASRGPIEEDVIAQAGEEPPAEAPASTTPAFESPYAEFEYDIFINYSSRDNVPVPLGGDGWVTQFERLLENLLGQYMGTRPRIFRDDTPRGDYLIEAIDDFNLRVMQRVAVMVCVVSPAFMASEWCMRALRAFTEAARETGGLHVGNRSRVVKVVSVPTVGVEPEALSELAGYKFFEQDRDAPPRPFGMDFGDESKRRFLDTVGDVAFDLANTLAVIRSPEAAEGAKEDASPRPTPEPHGVEPVVYLAETGDDLRDAREQVRRELEDRGYRVLPRRVLNATPGVREVIRWHLIQSSLSVHLIGSRYGETEPDTDVSIPHLQYELAAERGRDAPFSTVVWMPPGLRTEDLRQRQFIEEARNAGHVELLQSSLEELKTYLVDRLGSHSPAPRHARRSGELFVYLVDSPEDEYGGAREVHEYLLNNKYIVERASTMNLVDPALLREWHESTLLECDGVLIYYGDASRYWLRQQLRTLSTVEAKRSRPLKARAIYVGGQPTAEKQRFVTPHAMVIKGFQEFSPERLSPFIAALEADDEDPGGKLA